MIQNKYAIFSSILISSHAYTLLVSFFSWPVLTLKYTDCKATKKFKQQNVTVIKNSARKLCGLKSLAVEGGVEDKGEFKKPFHDMHASKNTL